MTSSAAKEAGGGNGKTRSNPVEKYNRSDFKRVRSLNFDSRTFKRVKFDAESMLAYRSYVSIDMINIRNINLHKNGFKSTKQKKLGAVYINEIIIIISSEDTVDKRRKFRVNLNIFAYHCKIKLAYQPIYCHQIYFTP